MIILELRQLNLQLTKDVYKRQLIYYARESWFIKMTAVKDDLIRNNNTINWIPAVSYTHLVVVRPSGTEPKIKIYYTTLGKNLEEAEAEKEKLAEALKPIMA